MSRPKPRVAAEPRSRWARLLALPGPARWRVIAGEQGATVAALPGRYCVSYLLLGPKTVVVVDIGSVCDGPRILAALDRLGRSPQQIKAVVATHLHMDHITGIDAFASSHGVPVQLSEVAHEAIRGARRLRFPTAPQLLRTFAPTYLLQGAPVVALADLRTRLEFGFPWSRNRFRARLSAPLAAGAELPALSGWRVLHTPGHADDAICLYHEAARFLVAGDTVRNFLGGEWNQLVCDRRDYAATQEKLRGLEVETIFPGHGPVLKGPNLIRGLRQLPAYVP